MVDESFIFANFPNRTRSFYPLSQQGREERGRKMKGIFSRNARSFGGDKEERGIRAPTALIPLI